MRKKSLISVGVLALNIASIPILITAHQRGDQPSGEEQARRSQPAHQGDEQSHADPAGHGATATSLPKAVNQLTGSANNAAPPRTDQQSKLIQAWEKAETDPVVWATVVIAIFAGWQVAIYRKMRDHTTIIERAYLAFDGFEASIGEGRKPEFTFRLNNIGHTPATIHSLVTGVRIVPSVASIKDVPPFVDVPQNYDQPSRTDIPHGFPVTYTVPQPHLEPISRQTWIELTERKIQVWFLVTVTYTDRFGKRHFSRVRVRFKWYDGRFVCPPSDRAMESDDTRRAEPRA